MTDRAARVWLPWGLVAVCLSLRALLGSHPFDDAYITYRYAANFASGLGLVYHAGERVLGTTTPLFATWLACMQRFAAIDPVVGGYITNLAADAANVLLLHAVCLRLGVERWAAGAATLVFATGLFPVGVAVGGMETTSFVACALGGAHLLLSRGWARAGVCLGLATLLRPEGMLAVGAASIALLHDRRALLRLAAGWAVLGCPAIVLAVAYYGSPIPNTVFAKAAAYHLPPSQVVLQLALAVQVSLWTPLASASNAVKLWLGVPALLVGAAYLFAAMLGGYRLLVLRARETWFLPLFTGSYLVFFLIAPLVPFTLPLAALGLSARFTPATATRALLALGLWQCVMWSAGGLYLPPGRRAREALYADVATWLRQNAGERARIVALRLVLGPGVQSKPAPKLCAQVRGVNIHASAASPGTDRPRIERLCRYAARPPLARARLTR